MTARQVLAGVSWLVLAVFAVWLMAWGVDGFAAAATS